MSTRRRVVAVIGCWFALASAPAAAEEPVTARRMVVLERDGALLVDTAFTELLDRGEIEALSSGLPATVAVRVYVYRADAELPVALTWLRHDVVYDLWDEVFIIRSSSPRGITTTRRAERGEAVAALTTLRGHAIMPAREAAAGRHHFVAIVAELNPVSEALQAEMRRWLTRRAGDGLDAGSSFFGSFVSVFVNPQLRSADRVVRLRSQPFYRSAP